MEGRRAAKAAREAEEKRAALTPAPPPDPRESNADCRLFQLYPDEGPLRRELYPRHVAFLNGGGPHRQRMFMAANRVGKTEGVGGYETTLHLTGLYPHWWRGRRFDGPISAMAAGDTAKTVRDIIQKKLLGPPDRPGAGLIPLEAIVRVTRKAGVADAIDTVRVRHAAGGESTLVLRSYDQGREAFQGDEHHVIWLDEEPPMAIYTECVMRTMTTNGYVMLTFTPLNGYSEVVRQFVDDPETVWV